MGIKEKLNEVPDRPGVYLFRDTDEKVLYVGKASSLRNRIRSYFRSSADLSARIKMMVDKVADIEWTVTPSEDEALLLESNLIKKFRPKYNVDLRDDKSYPLIKITMAEEYPRLFLARGRKNDGSLYFGPYTDAKLLRQAVKSIRKRFPFRTCHLLPKKACVYADMGLCPAPCENKISREEYLDTLKQIILFIEGKKDELLKHLTRKMKRLSEEKKFEEAAEVRDHIAALARAILKRPRTDKKEELHELKKILNLSKMPGYIEAFDISNIKGQQAAGSMVAFLDAKPLRSAYRMFKIKEVKEEDDYAMMQEVVRRRYLSLLKRKERLPDLILVDGGKGHLSSVSDQIKALGIRGVPIIGLAKLFEHIYALDRQDPIVLPPTSKALWLIQRIRDESHRFAIRYHHLLRSRIARESQLDRIEGIGPKRKAFLLKAFGSIEKIRQASVEELARIRGLNAKVAREIKRTIHV